jgi:hypothetical protein
MPLVRTPMIAPTKHYQRLPALTADQAAEMIMDAVRRRPKRILTPLGAFVGLMYATWPGPQDEVLSRIGSIVS